MTENKTEKKVHPGPSCPIGQHYVKTHTVTYRSSAAHPNGHTAVRLGHCASNPIRKTKKVKKISKQPVSTIEKHTLSSKEIVDISTHVLPKLVEKQSLPPLNEFAGSEKYDILILGWVQYWNDIFKPEESLDPKLIKALMASESSFRTDPPWLFHKKVMATRRLKKEATWMEGIAEYKGYLEGMIADKTLEPSGMNNIASRYSELKHQK